MRCFVAGLGTTGASVVRALRRQGDDILGFDDAPAAQAAADEMEIDALIAPGEDDLRAAVASCDLVVATPGLPRDHHVRAAARAAGVRLIGDIEMAASLTSTPIIAITGTNGKSTITRLVTEMLRAGGRLAVEAGNIGHPMLDAITEPAEYYVVEVSSFQLADTVDFHPVIGVWANLTADHLDWHLDLDHYVTSKTKLWENQTPADVAIVNAEDPVVMRASAGIAARLVSFGIDVGAARCSGGRLVGPRGEDLGAAADMVRPFPHEIANGLAAACAALEIGVSADACAHVLATFRGLPHRIELVGHVDGFACFDDSKATTPASVVTALHAFPSAVLIAGGKNKGLDLSVLAEASDHVRAVVAIGAAADEIVAAFDGRRPVTRAGSMDEAVRQAIAAAKPGDAVLLSPACTSWDAYRNYAERGDDFARAVHALEAS